MTLVPYNYIWKVNATTASGEKVSVEVSGRGRNDAKANFQKQYPNTYTSIKATNTHKCLGK